MAGEKRIEWRYERIYESKPTRLPFGAAFAAAAPVDLRPGPRRAGPGGAGPIGRGAVRALRGPLIAAHFGRGAFPEIGRSPAAATAAARSAAQETTGEQRWPRYAAAPQDHELFG